MSDLHGMEWHELVQECRRLSAENRVAFREGFDAGMRDSAEGGIIICPDFYEEVLEKAWQDYSASTGRSEND